MCDFILRVLGGWKVEPLATRLLTASHPLTKIEISLRWQDKGLGLDSLHRSVEVASIESASVLAHYSDHAPLYGSWAEQSPACQV